MENWYASRQFVNKIRSAWGKSKVYAAPLFHQRRTQHSLLQTFCRKADGCVSIFHPNVLPIIEVSVLFPFCIMSPWMPDGNIMQYTQMNADANRLALVRAHQLEGWWGESTDHADNSLHKHARALYTFTG